MDIKLLNKYTNYYFKVLRRKGYKVERDDVFSELGLSYTRALGSYKRDKSAKFSTYAIYAFKRHMMRYMKQLNEIHIRECDMVDIDLSTIPDQASVTERADVQLVDRDVKKIFLSRFKGNQLLMVKEMFDPSDKVIDVIRALIARRTSEHGSSQWRPSLNNDLVMAVHMVYGISERLLRLYVTRIKKEAKKMFDNCASV